MSDWRTYNNGNYTVKIDLSCGTKIRETEEDSFIPDHAENMDIKICNYCDMGCPYCHEGSTKNGKFADIMNEKFINTLHPYQEVALGGGDATAHPDLIPFLKKLKEKNIITNITVNQAHFKEKQRLIRKLADEKLVYGIGVSLVNPTEEFINLVKQYPNAVIHTIYGVVTEEQLKAIANKDLKILILGYKTLRRGNEYAAQNMRSLYKNFKYLYNNLGTVLQGFNTVSFDNLSLQQLNVKSRLSDDFWNEFYMGDDGTSTYYIDMVERKFARSSTAPFDKRYDLLDSVDEMFQKIRSESLPGGNIET